MNNLIQYLIESSGCLFIFYLVYWFFLRRNTFFRMNRMYLLAMVVFSMLAPLAPISSVQPMQVSNLVIMLEPVLITPANLTYATPGQFHWIEMAGLIYIAGVIFFTLLFLIKVFQLLILIRRSGITQRENLRLVLVDRNYSPFSFFNLIFISENELTNGSAASILTHEKVHIRQAHTFDMMIAEIFIILMWFNPLAWMIRHEIKCIHEYLADEGVLKSGVNRGNYQEIILGETIGIQINSLTNNFNFSLLKKRIIMMTKNRSSVWTKTKFLLTIPAMLVVVSILSANSSLKNPTATKEPTKLIKEKPLGMQHLALQNIKDSVYTKVENQPVYAGGQAEMTKFLIANIKYPANAKKNGIQGKVFVTFIVRKDGTVSDIKILRGIGGGCDEEALRVVKLMPKWTPGTFKGKPVDVQFNLPIKFALDSKKAPAEKTGK